MANWITHMMVADAVHARFAQLDRTGFCVGNIAPDCNIENEDWTAFTPPREVTHWMSGERKDGSDCERFFRECVERKSFGSGQERAFYLGYYSHLVTDACFQRFTRDARRVEVMFERIRNQPDMARKMEGLAYDYDVVKRTFGKRERMRDIAQIEYEYLCANPQSAYLTVLRKVDAFPEYLDYLPKGAIVRKLGVMAVLPEPVEDARFVFISRDEYQGFVENACEEVIGKLMRMKM